MSLQVCGCSWSKVTSYQGLRTHQGKKGCTPKGMRIPENQQLSFLPKISCQPTPITLQEPFVDTFKSSVKFDSTSEMSLQVCHCGWSKVTSYQGLRIHQGKKGCTPKGMTIPESEQYIVRNLWEESQKDYRPLISLPVKEEGSVMAVSQIFSTNTNPPATQTPVKETHRSLSETPILSPQTLSMSSDKARRALDFSTGAKMDHLLEPPTVTAQEPATSLKEKQKKEAREAEKLLQDMMRAKLQQKIHTRERKMAEIKSSAKAFKASLYSEWLEINNVFSEVMSIVEDARQKALKPLEKRWQKIKKEAQDLVQKLQSEIDKLKSSNNEVDKNTHLQVSPLPSLHDSTGWENLNVDASVSFGTLRATTSTMVKKIQQKLENLSLLELKRIQKFAVDVKLDSATAHQSLDLSDDLKTVRVGGKKPKGPDAPERFDMFGSVLGLNILTTGKSYWEVEVNNKTGWDLGVVRRSAGRKGMLTVNTDNGYWVTVHYEGKRYAALTVPPVNLSLKEKPQKVGVFVDYEEGLVSFYDVTAQSHIYSFTDCSFDDKIVPYFSPHLKGNGKNADPLIISAIHNQ